MTAVKLCLFRDFSLGVEKDKKYATTKAKFGTKLAAAYKDLGPDEDAIFDFIAALDPTATSKGDKHRYLYLEWICSRILREPPRQQDLYKIREDLDLYGSLARLDKFRASRPGTIFYRPYVNPEISQYATAKQLAETILPHLALRDRKKSEEVLAAERAEAEKNSLILYNGPEGRVVVPLTTEASQFWGKGTKWCISATKSDNLFPEYYRDGEHPILMFLPKGTNEKFAFNEYDRTAARNIFDEQTYDADMLKDPNNTRTALFGSFLSKALLSPSFAWNLIESDPHMVRTFQKFALRNPIAYGQAVSGVEEERLPVFLHQRSLIAYSIAYLGEKQRKKPDEIIDREDSSELRQRTIQGYFLQGDTLVTLLADEEQRSDTCRLMKNMETVVTGTVAESTANRILRQVMSIPDPEPKSKEGWLTDFRQKSEKLRNTRDSLDQSFSISDDMEYDVLATYVLAIPPDVWADEQFSADIVKDCYLSPADLMETVPQIFEHAKAWTEALKFIEFDFAMLEDLGKPRFAHIARAHVDGVPFIEAISRLPHDNGHDVIRNLQTAAMFHKAIAHVKDVDWSPLVRKLEEIYPDGFDTEDEIELATTGFDNCDMSALIEKSVARNPDLFQDVDPSRQTLSMVTSAINHNPEALADVAERFFNAQTRTPEMATAFRRMVEMRSPYIGMVQHHFTP